MVIDTLHIDIDQHTAAPKRLGTGSESRPFAWRNHARPSVDLVTPYVISSVTWLSVTTYDCCQQEIRNYRSQFVSFAEPADEQARLLHQRQVTTALTYIMSRNSPAPVAAKGPNSCYSLWTSWHAGVEVPNG